MDVLLGRQIPFKDNPELLAETKELLEVLVDRLSVEWLQAQPANNPVQRVWQRRDFLSTNELVTLGIAIRKLETINKPWIADQLRKVKSNDINTARGALFEILGLSFFESSVANLVPARANQPGYDAEIHDKSGASVRLSLKNYFISRHEQDFRDSAVQFETDFCAIAAQNNLEKLSAVFESSRYADSTLWRAIRNRFPEFLTTFKNGTISESGDEWFIGLSDLPSDEFPFSASHFSYSLLLISPFHQNEIKNLLDKLDEACANLGSHAPETDTDKNIVYVHLSRTASFAACREWSRQYLLDNPTAPISGVLFYQTNVVSDKFTTGITHFMAMEARPSYHAWIAQHPDLQLSFNVPIGTISGEALEQAIQDGRQTKRLPFHYVHQSGHHYKLGKTTGEQSYGEANKVASGIFTHSLLQVGPPGFEKPLLISGRFPVRDELEFL